MALQISISDTKWGIPMSQAYVRVVPTRIDQAAGVMDVTMEAYYSAATRQAAKAPVPGVGFGAAGEKSFRIPYDPAVVDPAAQAYAHVKADAAAWPEFQGATDV
jgi:hypothetical protein